VALWSVAGTDLGIVRLWAQDVGNPENDVGKGLNVDVVVAVLPLINGERMPGGHEITFTGGVGRRRPAGLWS
jgi:hypothetical protein